MRNQLGQMMRRCLVTGHDRDVCEKHIYDTNAQRPEVPMSREIPLHAIMRIVSQPDVGVDCIYFWPAIDLAPKPDECSTLCGLADREMKLPTQHLRMWVHVPKPCCLTASVCTHIYSWTMPSPGGWMQGSILAHIFAVLYGRHDHWKCSCR